MTTGNRTRIFVSSPHYGLEDLRGELAEYLTEEGFLPVISSEAGFPDHHGLPPYAQCLREVESCLLVIGIIDRRYGQPMTEWGPFTEYIGLSPTHAELRHALKLKKRVIVFVRQAVSSYYDIYRKNKDEFASLKLPSGLDVWTLDLYSELKLFKPAPWIESFRDVREVKRSIKNRLLSDLHEALQQRHAMVESGAALLLETILKVDPKLRNALIKALESATPDSLASKEITAELTASAGKKPIAVEVSVSRAVDLIKKVDWLPIALDIISKVILLR
jgi:hypothetical protein